MRYNTVLPCPALPLPPCKQVVIIPIPNSKMDEAAQKAMSDRATEIEAALKAAGGWVRGWVGGWVGGCRAGQGRGRRLGSGSLPLLPGCQFNIQ